MTKVAELLEQSRAAHTEYRQLARRPPKPSGWQGKLWDAYTLRCQADREDPHRLDPAWGADDNDALMAFYAKELGLKRP